MKRKLLSLATACMLLGFNPEVNAEVTYDLQASGKDNAAALGNLKMKALRSQLQQLLTPEDMKKNAKLLRNEIFLKINEYAQTGDDISYTQQGKKVLAQGQVKVQDDKLAETLGKISLLKPQSSQLADSTTTAAKTETVQASSAPEESAQAGSVPDKNAEVAATLPAPSSQDNSAPSQTDTAQASTTPEESAQVVATLPAPSSQKQPEATQAASEEAAPEGE